MWGVGGCGGGGGGGRDSATSMKGKTRGNDLSDTTIRTKTVSYCQGNGIIAINSLRIAKATTMQASIHSDAYGTCLR